MDNVGLILIGHGSKLPHNRENLEKLADILRKRNKIQDSRNRFYDTRHSNRCRSNRLWPKKGVSKIVLVPAFLAPGVHTTQDIPELIGVKEKEPQLKASGIELVYGEPYRQRRTHCRYSRGKSTSKPLEQEIKKDSEVLDAYSVACSRQNRR